METRRPEIFVVGGSNGSGKTTIAAHFLPPEVHASHFVNADFIAKGLSPHDPDATAFEAGRIMLRRIAQFREARETFAFESTLSSKSPARILAEAKRLGYLVHLVFLSLESSNLAVDRIRLRVEKGGHDIPEETVHRRYHRSHSNFRSVYMALADTWTLCDNSADTIRVAAYGYSLESPTVISPPLWQAFSRRGRSETKNS